MKKKIKSLTGAAISASMVIAAFFLWVSLLTFNPLDYSFHTVVFPDQLPSNRMGLAGSFLSDAFLRFFGVVAFVLPALAGYFFASLFFSVGFKSLKNALAIVGLISALCGLAQLSSEGTWHYNGLAFDYGGQMGRFFYESFSNLVGKIGYVLLFSQVALYSLLVLVSSFSVRLLENPIKKMPNLNKLSLFFQTIKLKLFSRSNENLKDQLGNKSQVPAVVDMPEDSPNIMILQKKEKMQVEHQVIAFEMPSSIHFCRTKKSHLGQNQDVDLSEEIKETLKSFSIEGEIVGRQLGPVLGVYQFKPNSGTKISRIFSLADDLALSLKVNSIFMDPQPELQAVGIQIPRRTPQFVYFGDLLDSVPLKKNTLSMYLGTDVLGKPFVADLQAMPHLLIAGATGSGKSVGINAILCSILINCSPDVVKMILVDPKMLELSVYEKIPHLLMPVITNSEKASLALQWAVNEMERRYALLKEAQVRNIESYNLLAGDRMPYLVIVIDELADLMMTAPKEVETCIQRLAQKARASGIHMILATQRPSVDIITGVIKANLPSRISFQVVSKHDSRTILDQIGAEKLLGKGDMLFMYPGRQRLDRIQCAYISDGEVIQLVKGFQNYPPQYNRDLIQWINGSIGKKALIGTNEDELDELFEEACQLGADQNKISVSLIQRGLKIGYNRAARIYDQMELRGFLGEMMPNKQRKWSSGSVEDV